MSEIINILHLTDIHFGAEVTKKNSQTAIAQRKTVIEKLPEKIASLISDNEKPDLVVISGDIGWGGIKSDYEEAEEWIRIFLQKLNLTTDDLIVCAGNHDLSREAATVMHRAP